MIIEFLELEGSVVAICPQHWLSRNDDYFLCYDSNGEVCWCPKSSYFSSPSVDPSDPRAQKLLSILQEKGIIPSVTYPSSTINITQGNITMTDNDNDKTPLLPEATLEELKAKLKRRKVDFIEKKEKTQQEVDAKALQDMLERHPQAFPRDREDVVLAIQNWEKYTFTLGYFNQDLTVLTINDLI